MPTLSEKHISTLKMLLRLNFELLSESHFSLLKEKICCSIIIELLIRQPSKYSSIKFWNQVGYVILTWSSSSQSSIELIKQDKLPLVASLTLRIIFISRKYILNMLNLIPLKYVVYSRHSANVSFVLGLIKGN